MVTLTELWLDQTPMAALGRAKLHLGENYEKYLKGRMQLIKYAGLT